MRVAKESRRCRGSWRLLLSALWIKTNGVPRLSSQAEKHHVRFCLLLLSLWRVMTCQNLTHTHTHTSHSVGKHCGGNLIIVFTSTPLLKSPTCHHHGSSIYGHIRESAEKVTLHPPVSSHRLPSSRLHTPQLLIFVLPAILFRLKSNVRISSPFSSSNSFAYTSVLSSLASVAIQYGLVVSTGTKAPLSGKSIQWNEGICEALHCSMYSCSIIGHFLQAGERSRSTAWGSESPGFTPSWWL